MNEHPSADVPVIEIGGTHVTAALVDTAAGHVREETRAHRPLDARAPADRLIGTILECAAELPVTQSAHWGVAVPGPFDYTRGIGRYSDVGKFDSLHGVDLRRALVDGLPARPSRVAFLNDAHAFALGEWTAGAARGHARAVGITLGTGVGSAFLEDGAAVHDGPGVPPRGHVHLLTVAGRPLEDTVSQRAIVRRYAEVARTAEGPPADVRDITERARDGEERARKILDEAFAALGEVLGHWAARFDATVVVGGGSIAGSWDLIAGPLETGLRRGTGGQPPGIALRPADRLRDAALLGAARHTFV